jgi:hypothetical protein
MHLNVDVKLQIKGAVSSNALAIKPIYKRRVYPLEEQLW